MTLVFAMLLVFVMASCDDNEKTDENLPDSGTEDKVDTGSTDTGDTEKPDTGDTENPDTGDTQNPDTGDTQNPDTGDTQNPDTGDTENPDTGDTGDTDTGDSDTDEGDTDEGDTECSYIPNAFVSNWTNNFPTDWTNKYDPTGDNTNGKKNLIAYEKIDRGGNDYALRAYVNAPDNNLYAFYLPQFITAEKAASPTKLTFDLKAIGSSKVSINLRCIEPDSNDEYGDYLAYNWDGTDSFKKTTDDNSNAYNAIGFSDNEFHKVSIVFGEELTKDFWQNKKCRIEFKYGKKKKDDASADFDITVDNFIFHTAAGDCIGEDTGDTGDTDTGDTDTGDSGSADPCLQIPNGKATNWDSLLNTDDNSWGHGTRVTYTTVDGALNIVHSKAIDDNDTVLDSEKFMTSADDDNIPIGIRFKLATIKPSKLAVSFHWGTGNTYTYYAYNWDETKKRFFLDPTPTKHNTYDYTKIIDLGDTDFHEVEIVFGDEITEEIWHNTTESKFIRLKTGKNTDDFEIRVKDFEFIYYGANCAESKNYKVDWASIEHPKKLTSEDVKIGLPQTFYGRVNIPGLTNATLNKSEFLMGVRAQFGIRAKNAEMDYEWHEADVNEAYNDGSGIGNAFGENDEYQYTYTFLSAGEYEYAFRFSPDNGKTWKKTSEFPDNPDNPDDHTGTGSATVPELAKDTILNGNFSTWISDSEPWLWTSDNGILQKAVISGNSALKVSATKGSAKSVLKSHSFEISDTAALPQKIALKLVPYQDNKLTISILLDCGENSKSYYKWNKTEHYFEPNNQFQYKNLEINFGNSNLNDTWIDTSAITAENWNGKTCYLEFKFGEDKNNNRWAIFDDITIVPAE